MKRDKIIYAMTFLTTLLLFSAFPSFGLDGFSAPVKESQEDQEVMQQNIDQIDSYFHSGQAAEREISVQLEVGEQAVDGEIVDGQAGTLEIEADQVDEALETVSATTQQLAPESALDKQITEWIAALSEQEPFQTWKNARWQTHPLGAGMHGWVVILHSGEAEIGYLVISAAADQDKPYRLVEYGSGPFPLFSYHTLQRSLTLDGSVEEGIEAGDFIAQYKVKAERIYMDALQTLWRIKGEDGEITLYDAKTGERYPAEFDQELHADKSAMMIAITPDIAVVHVEVESFDPYERISWVTAEAAEVSQEDLTAALLNGNRVTYIGKILHDQVTLPISVIGYQEWNNGTLCIILDQDGPRYVPYETLLASGHFHIAR